MFGTGNSRSGVREKQRGSNRLGAVALAVALLFSSSSAFADARSKARKYFEEGMRLIDAKRYGPGIESLIRANDILPHADVQYNIPPPCLAAGLLREAIRP